MPAVVAMTDRVTVATATDLTRAFYTRLRLSGAPDVALVEATAGLAERGDILVPALFCRPAGIPLFETTTRSIAELSGAEIGTGWTGSRPRCPPGAPALAPVLAGTPRSCARSWGPTRRSWRRTPAAPAPTPSMPSTPSAKR
jgi:hypothetical protein